MTGGALAGLLTRADLLKVRAGVVRAERERQAYFAPLRRRARSAEPVAAAATDAQSGS